MLAFGAAALGAVAGKRASNRLANKQKIPVIWTHSINDDLCVGCSNCADVCPKDVLELIDHKSKVLRFDDCIQCKECERACPTQALKMYREGGQPDPIEVPKLTPYYETDIAGLYLIGEAAMTPFVKNGVNLGRAVVEHMVRLGGLESRANKSPPNSEASEIFDVLIVGAGPAGLSAGMSCQHYGLSFIIVERGHTTLDTIMHYPDGKDLQPMPPGVKVSGLLPMSDNGYSKQVMMDAWNTTTAGLAPCIQRNTGVTRVQHVDGLFVIETDRRQTYRAQRVVLAVGGGAWRGESVPGASLSHVKVGLDDPQKYHKQVVMVLGGGNSAIEAAVSLAAPELENRVVLAYRGKRADMKASQKNRSNLESLEAAGRIKFAEGAAAVAFHPRKAILKRKGKETPFPCDAVFICYGRDDARPWLEKSLSIRYDPVPHSTFRRPPTDKLVDELLKTPLPGAMIDAIEDMPTTAYQPETAIEIDPSEQSLNKTPVQKTINILFSASRLPKAQIDQPMPTVAEIRRMIMNKKKGKT